MFCWMELGIYSWAEVFDWTKRKVRYLGRGVLVTNELSGDTGNEWFKYMCFFVLFDKQIPRAVSLIIRFADHQNRRESIAVVLLEDKFLKKQASMFPK